MSKAISAFTLIELLVSLTILVLVLTALISLYHVGLHAVQATDRTTGGSEVSAAIERLLRDLACAVGPDGSEGDCHLEAIAVYENEPAVENMVQLSFCATTPLGEGTDSRWYSIEHVTYRWAAKEPALIRISTPLVGGTAETNILAPRVEQFCAQFFDGARWHATWSTGYLPRAACIIWRDDGQTWTAETFIAAGMIFTSTVVSTAAPAAP